MCIVMTAHQKVDIGKEHGLVLAFMMTAPLVTSVQTLLRRQVVKMP
jgi:hypothetical protein